MHKLYKQALMVVTLAVGLSGIALGASDSVDQPSPTIGERDSSEAGKLYPAFEAGVRRAADEGPDALRHYIERTRTIYGFYYWDFAK